MTKINCGKQPKGEREGFKKGRKEEGRKTELPIEIMEIKRNETAAFS